MSKEFTIIQHKPGLFSCEAVDVILETGEDLEKVCEITTDIAIYVCPSCDNTHMTIRDTVAKVTYLHTFSPEAAEAIGKALINPPPAQSVNMVSPKH